MSTVTRLPRTCRVEVELTAPTDAVWRVVSDVTRIGEWSHECGNAHWIDGASSAVLGARFRGGNKALWWRWSRTSEIIDIQPGRALMWRTTPTWRFHDSTVWAIALEPLAAGTRIVQTFEVVHCPRWWEWLVSYVVPPHRDRRAALTADLERIGGVAMADTATGTSGTTS